MQYSALTNLQYWCVTPIRSGGSSERFAAVRVARGRQQLEGMVPVVTAGIGYRRDRVVSKGLSCVPRGRGHWYCQSDSEVEEVECVNVGRHGAPKETRCAVRAFVVPMGTMLG